jgi:hypothetical protein
MEWRACTASLAFEALSVEIVCTPRVDQKSRKEWLRLQDTVDEIDANQTSIGVT